MMSSKFSKIDSGLANALDASDIANNLTTTTAGKVLDATQGKALSDSLVNKQSTYTSDSTAWDTYPTANSVKPVTSGGTYSALVEKLNTSDVVANLTTTVAGKALDATQGTALNNTLVTTNNNTAIMSDILGAKNYLPNKFVSQIIDGEISLTVNSLGGNTISGTATTMKILGFEFTLPTGDYTIVQHGGSGLFYMQISDNPSVEWFNGITKPNFSHQSNATCYCQMVIGTGTYSNLGMNAMLIPQGLTNTEYAPYTMTNRQLTEYALTKTSILTPSTSYIAVNDSRVYRIGNTVYVQIDVKVNNPPANSQVGVGTLTSCIPSSPIIGAGYSTSGACRECIVNTNGVITVVNTSLDEHVYGNLTYTI